MTERAKITSPATPEAMAEMRRVLSYDPMTGIATWIVSRGAVRPGDVAGTWAKDDYRRFGLRGREYYVHQLAWFFMTGDWPRLQIDHKNGVRHDNRWDNLRLATTVQNHFNRRPQTKSGFKGVYQGKGKNGWVALCGREYLGYFKTAEDAARAYDRAAYVRSPEFSYLNFPRADYTDAGRAALEQGS